MQGFFFGTIRDQVFATVKLRSGLEAREQVLGDKRRFVYDNSRGTKDPHRRNASSVSVPEGLSQLCTFDNSVCERCGANGLKLDQVEETRIESGSGHLRLAFQPCKGACPRSHASHSF
jgi:hypothetical protein